MTDKRVIIVEGANYSGKSTLLRRMKKELLGSTVIEFHGYHHGQLVRMHEMGEQLTMEQIRNGNIPQDIVDRVKKYGLDRIGHVVEQVELDYLDRFIIERLHGTDFVYRNLQFGRDDFDVYIPLEDRLNAQGTALVVMTVDDDVLLERMRNTKKQERLNGKNPLVSHRLTDESMALRRRDFYDAFYGLSTIEHKLSIPSTNTTNVEDIVEMIKEL